MTALTNTPSTLMWFTCFSEGCHSKPPFASSRLSLNNSVAHNVNLVPILVPDHAGRKWTLTIQNGTPTDLEPRFDGMEWTKAYSVGLTPPGLKIFSSRIGILGN